MSARSVHGVSVGTDRGYNIGIVGSRTFAFESFPVRGIEAVGQALLDAGWPVGRIVSGGAEGADAAAKAFAHYFDIPYTECEPHFEAYDEAWEAFYARNSDIVRDSDRVVALWNGSSGTRDTLGKARGHLGDEFIHVHPIGGQDLSINDVEIREL